MVDSNPNDHTAQPAASLSAEDIKAMRGRLAARKAATDKYIYQQLSAEIAMDMPRLLDALEALTAERDRLQNHNGALQARVERLADLNDAVISEGLELIAARNILQSKCDGLKAEVERLTELLNAKQSALDIVWAENARMNQIERAAAEYVETAVALTRPHIDMQRTRAAFRNQPAAIQRLIAAVEGYADRDWCASHRRRVEAAHAAAKEDAE